ncbi:unnamed protein product, partial [Polarella glacialis]
FEGYWSGCCGLLSRGAFAGCIAAAFVCDLIVCILINVLGQSSEQEKHDTDYYDAATADTLEMCFVRVAIFPILSALALWIYRRTVSASPLVQLQRQEE